MDRRLDESSQKLSDLIQLASGPVNSEFDESISTVYDVSTVTSLVLINLDEISKHQDQHQKQHFALEGEDEQALVSKNELKRDPRIISLFEDNKSIQTKTDEVLNNVAVRQGIQRLLQSSYRPTSQIIQQLLSHFRLVASGSAGIILQTNCKRWVIGRPGAIFEIVPNLPKRFLYNCENTPSALSQNNQALEFNSRNLLTEDTNMTSAFETLIECIHDENTLCARKTLRTIFEMAENNHEENRRLMSSRERIMLLTQALSCFVDDIESALQTLKILILLCDYDATSHSYDPGGIYNNVGKCFGSTAMWGVLLRCSKNGLKTGSGELFAAECRLSELMCRHDLGSYAESPLVLTAMLHKLDLV